METDFYAALLVPPFKPDSEWTGKLAESLLHPQFTISSWEAIGRRLRRNYLWVYLVLLIAWIAKLLLYPDAISSLDTLIERAHMGSAPGWLVITVVLAFYVGLVIVAQATRNLRQAVGDVIPRYGEWNDPPQRPPAAVDPQMDVRATPPQPYPLLAVVSADALQPIADGIRAQFKRSAALLAPDNTTGTQETLLMHVNVTEIAALKALVKQCDPQGVVVVIPANEVFAQSATIQKAAE